MHQVSHRERSDFIFLLTVCVQLSALPSYLSLPGVSPIICFSGRVTSSTQLLFGMNTVCCHTLVKTEQRVIRTSFFLGGGGGVSL